MSAYVVNKATIDALVTFWLALEQQARGEQPEPIAMWASNRPAMVIANAMGRALVVENHLSMAARYEDHKRAQAEALAAASAYKFEAVPFDDIKSAATRVLGCLKGYNYQACEHGDAFTESKIYREMLEPLRMALEKIVPWQPSRWTSPAWQKQPVSTGWTINDGERDTALLAATIINQTEAA